MVKLPKTLFGLKGSEVTRIGLGGEGVLRTVNREPEAREVIQEAVKQGITYFDMKHLETAFQPVAQRLAFYRGPIQK